MSRVFKILKNVKRSPEVLNCMRKSEQWPDLVMSYLGFKGLDYPFTFKTRDKQQIVLETFHDLVTIWVIFFRQEYKVPSDCKVIIDAGANIGSFSIYASNEAPSGHKR
mgnify:FL=1